MSSQVLLTKTFNNHGTTNGRKDVRLYENINCLNGNSDQGGSSSSESVQKTKSNNKTELTLNFNRNGNYISDVSYIYVYLDHIIYYL
jgi:hypothetical protein